MKRVDGANNSILKICAVVYLSQILSHIMIVFFSLLMVLFQEENKLFCGVVCYLRTTILMSSSTQVTSTFLALLFHGSPAHRSLIFHTLSLLDSALPELHFLNLDLLNNLMNITIQGSNIISKEADVSAPPITKKVKGGYHYILSSLYAVLLH